MTAVELLEDFRAAGIHLWVANGALCLEAPQGAMTPERDAALCANRDALLQHLQGELDWRLEAMHAQAQCSRARPLLVARVVPGLSFGLAKALRRCLSCGESALGRDARCGLCMEAAEAVIATRGAAQSKDAQSVAYECCSVAQAG